MASPIFINPPPIVVKLVSSMCRNDTGILWQIIGNYNAQKCTEQVQIPWVRDEFCLIATLFSSPFHWSHTFQVFTNGFNVLGFVSRTRGDVCLLSACFSLFQLFSLLSPRPTLSSLDCCVPHDGLRSLAGWRASLTGLRCPSPTRKDGHAILLAQAFVRTPVGLDLFAQATFTFNDFQQLSVSLGLGGGRDSGLSLGQLGQLLELQLQVVLLLKLLELLL